jgi:glutamate transport system permease protein
MSAPTAMVTTPARRPKATKLMSAGSLFDAPGPRGRRVVGAVTAGSLALIAVGLWLAWRQFDINGQWQAERWAVVADWPNVRYLVRALGRTLVAAGAAALIALPLGLVLAVMRLSKRRLIRVVGVVIIEFFRAVPLLLIIYIFFFALPKYGINPGLMWKLTISIGLCSGATIAEVFRAGVLAVPNGQREAAAAIGLTDGQTFRLILFPQAVRLVVPSLIAQIVVLLKDTTLGYAVSYSELMVSSQLLTAISPGSLIQVYLVVSLAYVAINLAISRAATRLDRRWQTGAVRRFAAATRVA